MHKPEQSNRPVIFVYLLLTSDVFSFKLIQTIYTYYLFDIETLRACAFSSTFILCSIFDVTELSANPFRGCAF